MSAPKYPTPVYVVANRALLSTISTNNWLTGAIAQEEQTGSCWTLEDGDPPSGSDDGVETIVAGRTGSAPTRYFARIPGSGFDTYKYQLEWYISAAGNPVASGQEGDPITIKEWRLRVYGDQRVDMDVYLLDDMDGVYRGFYSEFNTYFNGVPTETAKVASATSSTTGIESNTITNNAVFDWSSSRQKFIRIGTKYAVITKDLTGNKARLGEVYDVAGTPGQAMPAAGAFAILTFPTITLAGSLFGNTKQLREPNVRYKFVYVNGPSSAADYLMCQVDVNTGSGTFAKSALYQGDRFLSCSIGSQGGSNCQVNFPIDFTGSVFGYTIRMWFNSGMSNLGNALVQSGGVLVCPTFDNTGANNSGGYPPGSGGFYCSKPGQSSTADSTPKRLGLFDCAVAIDNYGQVGLGPIYGAGNVRTLKVHNDSQTKVPTNGSGAITVTSTTADITVGDGASPIPALTAGAAVPATSALVTWANLYAAPYNGYARTTAGAVINGASTS